MRKQSIHENISKRAEGSPCLDYKEISRYLIERGFEREAIMLSDCSHEQIGWAFCGCSTHPVYRTCKLSICPKCRKSRAMKISQKFIKRLTRFRLARSIFDRGLRLLTLTIKTDQDLKRSDDFIRKAFVKFRHTKYVRERITSGFAVVEHVFGKKGEPYYKKGRIAGYYQETGWHVHIHSLINSRYMDIKNLKLGKKSKLLNAWNKAVGYHASIDIRRITSHAGALHYVLGDLVKSNFRTNYDVVEYFLALRGKRMFFTFGKMGELYNLGKGFKLRCPKCGGLYCFQFMDTFEDFNIDYQHQKPDLEKFI